jgi:hypothetical protein
VSRKWIRHIAGYLATDQLIREQETDHVTQSDLAFDGAPRPAGRDARARCR